MDYKNDKTFNPIHHRTYLKCANKESGLILKSIFGKYMVLLQIINLNGQSKYVSS